MVGIFLFGCTGEFLTKDEFFSVTHKGIEFHWFYGYYGKTAHTYTLKLFM